ncbi:hypothetical protein [Sphingomonas morindae]|uniref:Lipoprotein n=1 Tax=Sphingomonas morindae TaxID=1541170 RepID=A0ABY4X500_9SPHN|nr:hypothetical protein [Sphingomonas morindae]USI71977.1 hypothetical protein LHA26_11725 [Sphingomonas morindae]
MRVSRLAIAAGVAALAGCAHSGKAPVAGAPPAAPGAIAGTVAADRNGDGIADGWYSADGVYHAFVAPPCPPPPPPLPTRRGERG